MTRFTTWLLTRSNASDFGMVVCLLMLIWLGFHVIEWRYGW